ncbi:MAG TPA: hypothetical protein VGC42_22825 [Kofleriaceae bacterium]
MEANPIIDAPDGAPDNETLLPLNGGQSYNLIASYENKHILFTQAIGGQAYGGIKWIRNASSQSLAITFQLIPPLNFFTSTVAELTFDPADDGHQKAAVVPANNEAAQYNFSADVTADNGRPVLIEVDPIIVISVKP